MVYGVDQVATGRPKGTLNGETRQFKVALNNLLDHATPKMIGWLDEVAETDPGKALGHIANFAEYLYPKLSRAENTNINVEGVATLSTERLLQLERLVARLTGSEALLIQPEPVKIDAGDSVDAEVLAAQQQEHADIGQPSQMTVIEPEVAKE